MTVPRGPSPPSPTNEPASLLDIQTEFGGAAPTALNEYYAGGANVANPAPTSIYQQGIVPTSGAISIANFLGLKKQFVFNDVISSNFTTGYSLTSRAVAAGWDQVAPLIATVTINSGVVVIAPTTGTYAWTDDKAGGYPSGSTLVFTNNGYIEGAGGVGGQGGSVSGATTGNGVAGTAGGPAVFFNGSITTTMINNGIIGGGGGGGGGGASARNTLDKKNYYGAGGGGGGGGVGPNGGNGAAGTGGTATGNASNTPGSGGTASALFETFGTAGSGGTVGSAVRAGDGGRGGILGQPGYTGFYGDQSFVNGGQGAPGAGGGSGQAITGAGIPQWLNYGAIRGRFDGFGFWSGGGTDNSGLLLGKYNSPVVNTYLQGSWTTLLGNTWYTHSQQSGLDVNFTAGSFTYYTYYSNSGAPFTAHMYGAVDNSLVSMQVNGVAFTPGTAMGFGTTYQTNSFTIPTGVTVVRITLSNSAPSSYGFNLRLRNASNVDITHPSKWYF